jgi:8-oxo-dGTP pyrophosphatase MutT (NUDIX family)
MHIVTQLGFFARRVYWWMFRPRTMGVRAVIADESGRVLLVRHSYGSLWYLPGGGVEKGEGPISGLVRELREEVGIVEPAIDGLVGLYHSQREYKDDYIAVYAVAFKSSRAAEVRICSSEIEQLAFFPPSELPADVSPATRRRIGERFGAPRYGDAW